MVALLGDENGVTGSRKPHKTEAKVVVAQSWKWWNKSPRNGLAKRIGCEHEKEKVHWRRSANSSRLFFTE